MAKKPTYEELERRVKKLEKEAKERRGVEATLRENEKQMRSIVDNSPEMILQFDTNLNILWGNKTAHDINPDCLGKPCYEAYVGIKEPCEGCLCEKSMETGKIEIGTIYQPAMKGVRGESYWECIGVPLKDSEGKITGGNKIARNVTERKQVEEALRKSENKYRTLLEHLPQKIFHKDRNSVYLSCNENLARDFKIKPEEIKGKTDHEFFPKKLAKKYRADDKRIIGSGKTEDIEEKYVQDGKEIWIHTVKTPIKDEKGNVTGILGIFWDITPRKRAEKALREREAALKIRTNELEEVNSALRILLKQREEDKRELEEKVLLNIKKLVVPHAQKLKNSGLDAKQMGYLSVFESSLNDITAPLVHKLSSKFLGLTPAEIQTAHLVKEGKTTKEIAGLLNVSPLTIESRRKDIRIKLGIKNRKASLRSHLLSM